MRLILLAVCLLAAFQAHAAAPEQLASLDALFDKRAEAASIKELEDTLKKELQAVPEDYGVYSQAVGVLKPLKDGLEGKFNERLDTAIKINLDYERGSPLLAKGRYHYELPWPKRDLAETLLADGEAEKAREAILKVKQGSVAYDPAEGRRVQEWAKKVEAKIAEELE